jgi:GAF domain-containing protein
MEFTLGFAIAEISMIEGGRIRIKGTRGMALLLPELPLDGPGIVAKAVNRRTSIRIPDTRREEAYVDYQGRQGLRADHRFLSELAVPVVVEGESVAALNLESHAPNAFTATDQQLLEALAFHVASALKHLRQEEEIRKSSQFLEGIIENANVWLNVLDDRGNIYSGTKQLRL